jgi:hypothetical protein
LQIEVSKGAVRHRAGWAHEDDLERVIESLVSKTNASDRVFAQLE